MRKLLQDVNHDSQYKAKCSTSCLGCLLCIIFIFIELLTSFMFLICSKWAQYNSVATEHFISTEKEYYLFIQFIQLLISLSWLWAENSILALSQI